MDRIGMNLSPLQTGLLILGGLLLLLLVLYHQWVAFRARPRQSHATLLEDREEPRIDGIVDTPPGVNRSESATPSAPLVPALDPLIDMVVPVMLDQLSRGQALIAAMPHSLRVGSKRFRLEGLNAVTLEWEPPVPENDYTAVQVGLQLSDRHGPLSDIDFSDFMIKLQHVAESLGAHTEYPDMPSEVARARELDQFARQHDVQLLLVLRAQRVTWSVGYLVQQALQLGFQDSKMPGQMTWSDPQAPESGPLFILQFAALAALDDLAEQERNLLSECRLLFDVPQVPRSCGAYARLAGTALALAARLECRLSDTQGHTIDEAALQHIGQQLEGLYDSLEQHDLAAGSPLARRLFS